MSIQLLQGDCIEILRGMADESVDALITDPPYPGLVGGYKHQLDGVTTTTRITQSVGQLWDSNLDWIREATRVVRYGLMIFCTHHSVDLIAQECATLRKVALLTWYKRNAPPTGKNVPRFTTEFIWCFAKKPGLNWDAFKTTMLDIPNLQTGCMADERLINKDGSALHPTQKPVSIIKMLLDVTEPEQTVIDTHMGTGTTGVACMQTGRNFIGCEIDPGYFQIASRRIALAQAQPLLFEVNA